MDWTVPRYSKLEIDRAGRVLVSPEPSEADLSAALEVINNFRSSHSFPLNTLQVGLRNKARPAGEEDGALEPAAPLEDGRDVDQTRRVGRQALDPMDHHGYEIPVLDEEHEVGLGECIRVFDGEGEEVESPGLVRPAGRGPVDGAGDPEGVGPAATPGV